MALTTATAVMMQLVIRRSSPHVNLRKMLAFSPAHVKRQNVASLTQSYKSNLNMTDRLIGTTIKPHP
jgi:hypothetical protein